MSTLDGHARGRTSRGRLSALDAYLCHAERPLLEREGPEWVVDLGFGVEPWTTLELSSAVLAVNPRLRALGVEVDAARAEAAKAHATPQVEFRQGGFELTLGEEGARLVRAINVLRSYPPQLVPEIHARLSEPLVEGGLLVEGSTDREGDVLVAHLLRKNAGQLSREALLFHTNFERGFAPLLFRDFLPRDLRRRVHPGEPIHAFFTEWNKAWEAVRQRSGSAPAKAFIDAGFELAARGVEVLCEPWLLEQGYLLWRPKAGVPLQAALEQV